MMTEKLNLKIRQGETFQRVIRWARPPYIYKPITNITQSAPVEIIAPTHGLKTGWPAAVVSVEGMDEINASRSPPRDDEFHPVTVVTADKVIMNDINAAGFSVYKKGGYLQFLTPFPLVGYSAEIDIKDEIGGKVLLSLSTGADGRIVIDSENGTITLTIAAEDTASDMMTWTQGVWDLEMKSPSGQVTTLYSGNVTVLKEVTTEN